jgi:glycosyltransferase involved in cell wall biosynthesis
MASPTKSEVISLFTGLEHGGVNQVVMNLIPALREQNVSLTWLACGAVDEAGCLTQAERFKTGELVEPSLTKDTERAEAYRNHILARRPSVVLFHILCGPIETNLAAYLPTDILRIAMVHNITPATYRAARAMRDFFHAAIGVSPRISEDLVRFCGFPADAVFCVPNGVDCRAFLEEHRTDSETGPLRIISCGRIEDISKGIFWVPEIVAKARALRQDITLTIAGDGPDRLALEKRVDRHGLKSCTSFRGWVNPKDVPRLYAEHDVFLFPSRFEGLGLALVEAMAGGCVPIATRLRGVTDFVVQDGYTGYLFPSGDVSHAARLLIYVASDRKRLFAMRRAARATHLEKFDIRKQARTIAEILDQIQAKPRRIRKPLPLDEWRIARGLRPAWWTTLPEPLKNQLRVMRERVGIV